MYLKKLVGKGKSHCSFSKQYKNLPNLLEMLLETQEICGSSLKLLFVSHDFFFFFCGLNIEKVQE